MTKAPGQTKFSNVRNIQRNANYCSWWEFGSSGNTALFLCIEVLVDKFFFFLNIQFVTPHKMTGMTEFAHFTYQN